jgi:hypothetical protein
VTPDGCHARLAAACVDGLDVGGASLSVLTATEARETLSATDDTAELLEELRFTLRLRRLPRQCSDPRFDRYQRECRSSAGVLMGEG